MTLELKDNCIIISIFGLKIKHRIKNKKNTAAQNTYKIGEHSYCAAAFVSPTAKIGKYCSIASGAIIGVDNHPTNWATTSPHIKNIEKDIRFKKVEIGNDVWIGANAIIVNSKKDNIKIGNGAIIAAGAVVTKDIPPYAIAAGIPAKIIKYRFSDEIISRLLQSKWWDIPISELKNLDVENVEHFLEQIETRQRKIYEDKK